MKTFTVRDLDREPSRVLDTCDVEGSVQIRRRDGRIYTVQAAKPPAPELSWADWVAERRRRTKEIFGDQPPMTKKEARDFDRMVRSE